MDVNIGFTKNQTMRSDDKLNQNQNKDLRKKKHKLNYDDKRNQNQNCDSKS